MHRYFGTEQVDRDGNVVSHYRVSATTGAIAAGAGADSEILQIRNPSATIKVIPLKLTVTGMRATTAFAVGAIDVGARAARAWTVDGTGGTPLTLTNNDARTSMGAAVATIRIATTAALGAGTKTLDDNNCGGIVTHSSGGFSSATPIVGSIYLPKLLLVEQPSDSEFQHPFVFVQNEGLVVRATVPITGVWNIGFDFEWAEVARV